MEDGLDKTTTDIVAFNTYNRVKDKPKLQNWYMLILISVMTTIAIVMALYASELKIAEYVLQVWIVLTFICLAFIIPNIIKDLKLTQRGTPFKSIKVDYPNGEIIIENYKKGLYSYGKDNIYKLNVFQISNECSLWSINDKSHFKVPHDFSKNNEDPKLSPEIRKKDNKIIVKLIGEALSNNKEVKISGPYWNLKNILKEDEVYTDKEEEVNSLYIANESIGSIYYVIMICVNLLVFLVGCLLFSPILIIGTGMTLLYYIYEYVFNPSFNKEKVFKHITNVVSPPFFNNVKELNPEMAYILTVPYKIIEPYGKEDKDVEQFLMIKKDNKLYIRSSSGVEI